MIVKVNGVDDSMIRNTRRFIYQTERLQRSKTLSVKASAHRKSVLEVEPSKLRQCSGTMKRKCGSIRKGPYDKATTPQNQIPEGDAHHAEDGASGKYIPTATATATTIRRSSSSLLEYDLDVEPLCKR